MVEDILDLTLQKETISAKRKKEVNGKGKSISCSFLHKRRLRKHSLQIAGTEEEICGRSMRIAGTEKEICRRSMRIAGTKSSFLISGVCNKCGSKGPPRNCATTRLLATKLHKKYVKGNVTAADVNSNW